MVAHRTWSWETLTEREIGTSRRDASAATPFFADLDSGGRTDILDWYTSAHAALDEHGYVPAYDEAEVEKTSALGCVPDWVYVRRETTAALASRQIATSLWNTFSPRGRLSDHAAVLVSVERLP